MLKIKTINGRLYVVTTQLPRVAAPIGGMLAVYCNGRLIGSRDLYPHDSEESLLRDGWEIAELHASSPGV